MTFITKYSVRYRLLAVLTACFLATTFSLNAQKTDTIGTTKTINTSEGPIIRTSNTAPQYSFAVYLFTEAELIAKGIYPGAVIHSLGWQRGTGNFNPTLISGATAAWKIAVKDGSSQTRYTTGVNIYNVYNYTSTGFTPFGFQNFDDAANNLPTLQEQWMIINAGSAYTYQGGSLEVYSNWAITAVAGAGNPTSTGAINWYASVPSTAEPRTIRATSSTAITGPNTLSFLTSTNRPNIIINYTPAPACSGTPAVNTIADSSVYCPGQTYVKLLLSGFKAAPGLNIQWQSSIAGANNFSNLPNRTTTECLDTTVVAKDYRAIVTCTGSGLSSTTAVRSISISAPAATPVSESFSSAVLPSCWSMSSSNTNAAGAWLFTGSPISGASPANNGRAAGTFAWTDNSFKAADKTLYMPFVNLSNLTKPQLKFELFSNYVENIGNEGTFKVDVLDNNVWTTIFTNKGSKASWRAYTIPLTAYAGKSIQVRFVVDETATVGLTNDILLDAVAIRETPKCPEPSDLTVSNITPVAASLNWTENGGATQWQIAYDTGTVNPATAPRVTTSTKPITINNLRMATDYQAYVRSICGPGDTSEWSIIAEPFATICPASFTPGYSQDFAKWPAPCWEIKTGLLGTNLAPSASTFWRSANWMHTGTTNKAAEINLFGTNKYEWLVSPSLDLGSGSTKYQLDFDLAFLNSSTTPTVVGASDDTFAVVISTDNGATWKIADVLAYWTMNNTPFEEGYQHVVLDLSKYNGLVKVGFYAGSRLPGGNSYIIVDNVSVSVLPSCRVPVNATARRVSHKSAQISWTETGTATEWQIEYGPAGFNPGSGKVATATTQPYTLNDLDHSTVYDYYVRSVCSPNDRSALSIVKSFRTLCVAGIPYSENFDAGTAFPVCMSQENFVKESPAKWQVATTSSNALSIPNYLKYDSYDANFYSAANNWLYTPGLTLGADTSYTITFAYRTQYPQGYTDSFKLWMGTANSADSMMINPYLFKGVTDTNYWVTAVAKVTPTKSGVYYLGFQCISDSGYSLFFDDISVVKTFVCYPPTALTATAITTTGANMGWTENNGATQWSLEYGPSGFTIGTGTRLRTDNNPYVLPVGLDDSTKYDFYVRSICSPGDTSKWSELHSFATQCIYPEVVLGNDTTTCAPYIIESGNLGLSRLWNTGDQTASIIAKTSGNYWVRVSKTNGCSSTDSINLTLVNIPSIDSITQDSIGLRQVKFTAYTSEEISSYLWDFGDGQISTSAAPTHTYALADTYTVSLIVGNMCGIDSLHTEVLLVEEEVEPIGIRELKGLDKLIGVYPNPADHFVIIDNKSKGSMKSISMLSVSGAVLWEAKDIGQQRYTLQTGHLPSGIYLVRIVTDEGVVSRKVELIR